ncbi:hypothetical protein [Bacteroides thetaiotaomicron]|uniref:hypothetical protein n=1 Tax=Bacteroides thetaiotaomicron TaxID=818 RepID=UPI0035673147
MKAVVTLSKKFFPQHPRKGEETLFREKVISGSKRHTCRSNYEYWKAKIDRLKEVGGVLSLRQWSANPYRSPQEIVKDIPAELVGVQKLILHRKPEKIEHYEEGNRIPAATITYYEYTAEVDGYSTLVELLAVNDGLTPEEFKAWFAPVFDKEKADTLEFAIIHFTKERY